MTKPNLPLNIDSTMIAAFRSCPQKFWLEFCHGFRPQQPSIDLHAGACFAHGVEAVYRAIHEEHLGTNMALDKGHAAFLIAWGDFEIPEYKKTAKTKDRMWEAVENYFGTYPPLSDHIQPYFDASGKPTFEFTFAIPLEPTITFDPELAGMEHGDKLKREHWPCHPSGVPFIYSGRLDMLGSYLGRPIWRDEKTTGGSIGQSWPDQWDLRSQFIGYTWAMQQCGIDCDTGVVRGVAIQKTQIVHAEAIKTYDQFKITRWLEQLRRDLWRMRRMFDEDYFDFNLADACTSYGGCMFKDVCSSPNFDSWTSHFRIQHWNPLEKNPVKETTP